MAIADVMIAFAMIRYAEMIPAHASLADVMTMKGNKIENLKYCLSKYTIEIDKEKDNIFLYNTFSGSIVKLNVNEYTKLKKNAFEEKEIKYFKELKSQGFIVNTCTDEYLKMKEKAKEIQHFNSTDTLSYVIAPTLNCNYNCIYCFESKENRAQKMTSGVADEIIKFIIDQIEKIKTIKNVKITWFGGEPLLSYDLIVNFSTKLVDKLNQKNINYQSNMITNGLLLSKDKVLVLSNKCNLKHVQITLDGFRDTYARMKKTSKKSFNKVVSNIIDAYPYVKITIRLNTNKTNYEEMKLLSTYLLEDCKLKNKVLIYLAEIKNYSKEKTNNYYCAGEFLAMKNKFNKHLLEKHLVNNYKISVPPSFEPNFCGILKKHNYAIGPKGELYKCEHYFGNNNKAIGDIYNGLYYNEEYKNFVKGNSDLECINCELSPCCRSDCHAMYECHKQNGQCLIHDDLLNNLKNYIKDYISNTNKP